jgi:DNA modification methylase
VHVEACNTGNMQATERKKLKINELINSTADYNPRKISEAELEKLKNSIKKFGYVELVIFNQKTNTIVGGHQRLKALKELGFTEVECVIGSWTEAEEKELNIALNKISGEWDDDKLSALLLDIKDTGDIEATGFDGDELNKLLLKAQPDGEVEEDDFDAEAAAANIKEPTTKPGDLYQLGRHRLLCGDSTKLADVERLMGGGKADLFLTDPPYNVDYTGKTKEQLKIDNDKKSDSDFRQFLRDAFTAANAVMKAGAVFYIWHADSEGYNFRGACHDIGWTVRQCLVWQKNIMVMGRQDYHWKHEPCLYGWKDGASHLWCSDRKQTTLLEFERPTKNKEHPTMKPVKLFDYQIQNNTKGEDVVLDLFGGSGTTLVACEQNGRNARLMELDPKYCDVIVQRWEKLTGQKAQLLTPCA